MLENNLLDLDNSSLRQADEEVQEGSTADRVRPDYGGKKKLPSRSNLHDEFIVEKSGWFAALTATLDGNTPSALAVVNNDSGSESDRRFVDQQLTSIASITSAITFKTTAGREPRVVYDEVGFPPFTFSTVQEFRRGSTIILSNSWLEDGMRTLIHKPIVAPPSDDERRAAILYGIGPIEQLEVLEQPFLRCFDPSYFCKSFGGETNDGVVKFFVQWELFPEELAMALGIKDDSKELGQLLDILVHHSERQRFPTGPIASSVA